MRGLLKIPYPLLSRRLLLSAIGIMGLLVIINPGHAGETCSPSQDETSVHSSQASSQNPATSQNAPTQNKAVIPKRSDSPSDVQLVEQILSTIETSLDKKHEVKDDTDMHWDEGFRIKMTLDLATEQRFPEDQILKPNPKRNPGLSVLVSEIIGFERALQKMSGKGNVDLELKGSDGKPILVSKLKLTTNSAGSLSPRSTNSTSTSLSLPPDANATLKSRYEVSDNIVLQSMIDLVVEGINARNPFEVSFHYHTSDNFKVLIEVNSEEVPEKDQLHLSLPDTAKVPTTDQLMNELDTLFTTAKQVKGKGTIHVRIEKSSGRLISDKLSSFSFLE